MINRLQTLLVLLALSTSLSGAAITNRFVTPTTLSNYVNAASMGTNSYSFLTNYFATNVPAYVVPYVTNYVETNATLLQVVASTNIDYDFSSIGTLTNASFTVALTPAATNSLVLLSVSGNVPVDFVFKARATGSNVIVYASNVGSNAVDPDSLYYMIRLLQ